MGIGIKGRARELNAALKVPQQDQRAGMVWGLIARVFGSLVRRRVRVLGGKPISIAMRAGLHRDAIRSVLRGHPPRLDLAAELCDALGLEARAVADRRGGERRGEVDGEDVVRRPYQARDYYYPQSVEPRIVAEIGNVYGPSKYRDLVA